MRMTNQRKTILTLLSKTRQPKSAEMILLELPNDSMKHHEKHILLLYQQKRPSSLHDLSWLSKDV